ncbi:hypothetical protein HMPREF0262_03331 [Clostridium sp. ATCC 29733]|nr:hypothetical protein HMPREF0262_03331 [Clostridium sp. ATCC 29733]
MPLFFCPPFAPPRGQARASGGRVCPMASRAPPSAGPALFTGGMGQRGNGGPPPPSLSVGNRKAASLSIPRRSLDF